MFLSGFIASSRCSLYCGFNTSFGNAFRLSNVGFDKPPTVYTAGFVTVRGIEYFFKWLVVPGTPSFSNCSMQLGFAISLGTLILENLYNIS